MSSTPSPITLLAGAALLGGGFFLLGGGNTGDEVVASGPVATESVSTGAVSFEELTGVSVDDAMGGSDDLIRNADGSLDTDAQPWLIGPTSEQLLAAVEAATGVESSDLVSSEFTTVPPAAGAERDRRVRYTEVTFRQPGSLRRWRADIVLRWTDAGWTLDRNLTGLGPAETVAPDALEADNG